MKKLLVFLLLLPSPAGAEVPFSIRETAGVARVGEVVRSGVPVPRVLALRSLDGFTVLGPSGAAVPAELEVLGRYNAGKDDVSAPIQWVQATFVASAGARGTGVYRLARGAAAPLSPLVVVRTGTRLSVATGPATFVVDSNGRALFEEVRAGSTVVGTAGPITGIAGGRVVRAATNRRFEIESGQLVTVVTIEDATDLPLVGPGGFVVRRRYEFRAGSPTALVRISYAFEGDRCGMDIITCGQIVNGLLLERLRLTIAQAAGPKSLLVVGARGSPITGSGDTAHVRQFLRARRLDARAFDAAIGSGAVSRGVAADGAVLASTNPAGFGLAVSFSGMDVREPAALRLVGGALAVDVVDDKLWLANRQGSYAEIAVTALSAPPSEASLAPARVLLDAPLRAWPDAAVWAETRALGEVPVGPLPPEISGYDALMKASVERTKTLRIERGVFGATIFGAYPRTWGSVVWGEELDCGNDPTPADDSDDAFWCGAWADYHNTTFAAAAHAARTGEVEAVDAITKPAALRMLHTQILQCAPSDGLFFCGQAPMGYGGFRLDNNGSHAYWETLQAYYWLTGDRSVLEVERGARSMRQYLCARRPGAACLPGDVPIDEWAQIQGRVASQWFLNFRFLGLALDPSYLDDWRSGLARMVTQHYAEAEGYGFITPAAVRLGSGGAASIPSDQLWMASIYDMKNLECLRHDTDDAPIGTPPIPPSRVLAAWARTLARFGPTLPAGQWPNRLTFTVVRSRLGGTLGAVLPNIAGGDPYLWDTGRADIPAALLYGGEAALRPLAVALTAAAIADAAHDASPMNKRTGLFLATLPAAVARLTGAAPPAPPPATAPVVVLSSSLDDYTSISAPSAGPSGGFLNVRSADFVTGQIGKGVRMARNQGRIYFGLSIETTTALLRAGDVEFWYQPDVAPAGDALRRSLVLLGDECAPPFLGLDTEQGTLRLRVVGADKKEHRITAPIAWRAGQWVRIRAEWNAAAPAPLALFVNETRVAAGGSGAWSLAGGAQRGVLTLGTREPGCLADAAGALDDLRLRRAP